MSNRTKIRTTQRERVEMALMPGACLNRPDEIAAMRKRTHDEVIRLTGRNRRGGVRWLLYFGREDCERQFRDLFDPGMEGAEQYLGMFAEYPEECALVVAMVPSVVPAGVIVNG